MAMTEIEKIQLYFKNKNRNFELITGQPGLTHAPVCVDHELALLKAKGIAIQDSRLYITNLDNIRSWIGENDIIALYYSGHLVFKSQHDATAFILKFGK